MTLTLAEGLIDALNTYITANITAKLAALDTEYTDSIVLAVPVATYVGIKSLKSIPQYPAMFIFSPSQRIQARNVGEVRVFPEVVVGIVEQDADSETLQRRLYRYGRALVELVQAADPAGWIISTGEGNEWVIDHVAAPNTDSEDSDFTGEVSMTFRAYAWEN